MNKIAIFLIFIILASTGCVANQEKESSKPEEVTVGVSATSLLPSLVYIAKEKGYFLEEGIQIEIKGYPTGKHAFESALKGEIDIATVADTPIVFNSFERDDFLVFATILDSTQHAKVLARKDKNINTPQDLVGKKVATTIGTTAHFFMNVFFIVNEVDSSNIKIVDLKPKEMVNAIVAGEVDAIFAWEPNIVNSEIMLGDNAIVLPSDVGYLSTFNMASKKDFIESNPELITKILKALAKAEQTTIDNREESVDIVASYLKTDRERIDSLWDIYKFRLSLSQTLLITLEDEARWAINNNMTDATEVPNYLGYIYLDALEEVKPEAVGIIR